jgi:phage terminase large subunit-like protein
MSATDLTTLAGYDSNASADGYYYDAERADDALAFIETACTHVKGKWAGEPMRLQPWQRSFVAMLFGWRHKDTGLRRYREAFLYVPRKNGKTALVAAISLYMLLVDEEAGRECYAAAADREQAALLFNTAKAMVLKNPAMCDELKPYMREISRMDGGGFFKTISRDGKTKHGFNTSFACIDELHAQQTPELVEVLQTSMGSREQPLMVFITTADYMRESICNDKYDYAKKVRDGQIDDPAFLPAIWEASQEDDWESEEVWKKANPNYGVSVFPEYLRREALRAREDSAYRNTFQRLHLNIRTDTAVAWLNTAKWDASGQAAAADIQGCPAVTGGLDLGVSGDYTAFALAGIIDDVLHCKVWYWIPSERIDYRQHKDKVPLIAWVNAGHIKATQGNITDFTVVQADVAEICKEHNVSEVAYDPYLAMQMASSLQDDHGIPMVEFRQSAQNYHSPCKQLERLVNGQRVRHDCNPVLRHNVTSCMLRVSGDKVLPDKRNSVGRIDGLIALLMAFARVQDSEGVDTHYRDNELFTC